MPLVYKRHQLVSEGVHATHWAFMQRLLLQSSRLLEQGMISLPPQNLGVTYMYDLVSLVLPEVLLGHHFIYSGNNVQLVGSRVMDTIQNDSIVGPILNALAIEATRIEELEPHFIL
jgi:hypothetical protein